jgi:membrane protein YdbS with pleckstrin-like domain
MSNIPANTPPPTTPAGDRPHKEPSDAEEIYYNGSPLMRGLGVHLLLWPLAGIVLIVVPFLLHSPTIPLLVSVLIGLCLPLVPVAMARSVRYRISNYRIDYERGFLAKDIDTLELWHVEDMHFHQSLLDRLLGVGTIRVTSRDQTLPQLNLRGLPNPRPLYETLKQRVIAVKRSRGVIKVDPG